MRVPSEGKGRAVSLFPSLSTRGDINQTVFMFIEDVHLAVMPIGGRTDKFPDFSATITGQASDRKRALLLLASLKNRYHDGDKEAISDRVNEIAEHLSWRGRAFYEIVQNAGEQNGYSLHGFTSAHLIRVPGFYIQLVPLADYKYVEKRFIVLPSKLVWEITMPRCLGGVRGYRTVLSRLKRFDILGPKFWQRDLEMRKRMPNFSLIEYVGIAEAYQSRVTKEWGWNRRDYTLENNTEYYSIYKRITRARAQALLRTHIINEINKLLRRLSIAARIEINGLPSADDVSKILGDLAAGKLSFTRALDSVSF